MENNSERVLYIDKYVVCAAIFVKHVVCASALVSSLPGGLLPSRHRRRSIAFRVLFQQTNKQEHKRLCAGSLQAQFAKRGTACIIHHMFSTYFETHAS